MVNTQAKSGSPLHGLCQALWRLGKRRGGPACCSTWQHRAPAERGNPKRRENQVASEEAVPWALLPHEEGYGAELGSEPRPSVSEGWHGLRMEGAKRRLCPAHCGHALHPMRHRHLVQTRISPASFCVEARPGHCTASPAPYHRIRPPQVWYQKCLQPRSLSPGGRVTPLETTVSKASK